LLSLPSVAVLSNEVWSKRSTIVDRLPVRQSFPDAGQTFPDIVARSLRCESTGPHAGGVERANARGEPAGTARLRIE